MSTMKKGEVNIRPMERRDIDGVLAVERRTNPAQSVLARRELTACEPGGTLDLSFVAEANNKIVGFVLARLTYAGMPVSEVGVIQTLAVDPDYRLQGISAKLLSALSSCCQTEGVSQLRAVVSEQAAELKDFFEKMGFCRSELINYIKTFET
jgi:N-acetylglutamate synthase-like GNAT family acetyltransferase